MTNGGDSKTAATTVYLGLGSNLRDRKTNLNNAIALIKKLGLEVVRESSIYETEPVGVIDQPWFLNQVIETRITAGLPAEPGPISGDPETIATVQAEALLSGLLDIECAMGRERTIASGPRLIDIDLLLFGDIVIARSTQNEERPLKDRAGIVVPHPRMHLRRFVLEPLCEIAPDLVHPALNKTCCEILETIEDPSVVRVFRGKT